MRAGGEGTNLYDALQFAGTDTITSQAAPENGSTRCNS